MKKGISAVIAIVLILMITVALAAAAYVWFSGVFETITEGVGDAATGVTEKISTDFTLEAAVGEDTNTDTVYDTLSVSMRNTGTQDIDLATVAFYIAGKNEAITDGNEGMLVAGAVKTLKITGLIASDDPCDKALKVTTGAGTEKSTTIECY